MNNRYFVASYGLMTELLTVFYETNKIYVFSSVFLKTDVSKFACLNIKFISSSLRFIDFDAKFLTVVI